MGGTIWVCGLEVPDEWVRREHGMFVFSSKANAEAVRDAIFGPSFEGKLPFKVWAPDVEPYGENEWIIRMKQE